MKIKIKDIMTFIEVCLVEDIIQKNETNITASKHLLEGMIKKYCLDNEEVLKMDFDKREEINAELRQEEREEPMYIWIEENLTTLEGEFINTFPPEDQPLDDDIPDFLDKNCDDFDEYARKQYHIQDEFLQSTGGY